MYITIIFKHLSGNCLTNQSQILYEASIGMGDQCVYKKSRKHDQDGHHAYIWYKPQLVTLTVLVDSQVSNCCPHATCFVIPICSSV